MGPGPSRAARALRVVFAGALAAITALPGAVPVALGAPTDPTAVSPVSPATRPAHKKSKKHKPKHKAGKVKVVAQKQPAPPPLPPLDGTSYDYDYDGHDVGHAERRWLGRAFVHRKAAALAGQGLPVLVFLHGNNSEAIKYRWMGGGTEGDLRRILSEMIEAGQVPPMVIAAPSSIDPYTMTNAGASWPGFDLDVFLDKTADRLGSAAVLDRSRVIVAAHSGGGCNIHGGLNSAVHARRTPVLAGFSIDTCMLLDLAKELAHVRPRTHVVVSWQAQSWPEREFGSFKTVFLREVKKAPAPEGVLRELDYVIPTVPMPHDAMVGITLRKWLPRVLAAVPVDTGLSGHTGSPVGVPDGGPPDGPGASTTAPARADTGTDAGHPQSPG